MVYLEEKIKSLETQLDDANLASLCYFFINDRGRLGTVNIESFSSSPQEYFSAKGFLSLVVSEQEIEMAKKPGYKGIDIGSTIFKLIGAYLAAPNTFEHKLQQKFDNTSFKNRFLIGKCVPSFQSKFVDLAIGDDPESSDTLFSIIAHNVVFSEKHQSLLARYKSNASDVIDLLVLYEFDHLFARSSFTVVQHLNLESPEVVRMILANFRNSVKKITNRRKDHSPFTINDEYDVQDVLYVIMKSIFPTLKEEDPTPKVGIKSNKIDLIIREEGILVEVKMIKATDSNEKDFVEQLKNDIQSYYQCPWLKYLYCFVYDPYGKTRDVQNFHDLNGRQTINGVTFDIDVIVVG